MKNFLWIVGLVFIFASNPVSAEDSHSTKHKHGHKHKHSHKKKQAAKHHAHSHHGHAEGKSLPLTLNDGKKWATDKHLRSAMERIHDDLKKWKGKSDAGKMTLGEYNDFAAGLDKEIKYIFSNCKLSPAADAQLHIVLAQMLGAKEQLQGGKKVPAKQGFDKVLSAYKGYKTFFESL